MRWWSPYEVDVNEFSDWTRDELELLIGSEPELKPFYAVFQKISGSEKVYG